MEKQKAYGKPPCQFKIEIDAEEYKILIKNFDSQGYWSQAFYTYFDTDEYREKAYLASKKLRLRSRVKKEEYSLELKSCQTEKHWEISQRISHNEYRDLFQGKLPEGKIKNILLFVLLPKSFKYIGQASTVRKKIFFHQGILVIDQTSCISKTRYQIEFRSNDSNLPESIQEISSQLNVLMRNHHSKVEEVWVS